jgi:hypothetical protein
MTLLQSRQSNHALDTIWLRDRYSRALAACLRAVSKARIANLRRDNARRSQRSMTASWCAMSERIDSNFWGPSRFVASWRPQFAFVLDLEGDS